MIKKTTGFFLAFLVTSFMVIPLGETQEMKEPKGKITVFGRAMTRITPDRARIFLGIETMDPVLDIAQKENVKKMNQVIKAINALKIKDLLIKAPTLNVSLVKESEYEALRQARLPRIIGYRAKQEFTLLLKDDDPKCLSKNTGLVIETALKNGANLLEEVMFFKEDDSEQRRKTLALAVEDAMVNAQVVAKAAGVSIDKYNQIRSSYIYTSDRRRGALSELYQRQQVSVSEVESGGTILIAGELGVSYSVEIECSIK